MQLESELFNLKNLLLEISVMAISNTNLCSLHLSGYFELNAMANTIHMLPYEVDIEPFFVVVAVVVITAVNTIALLITAAVASVVTVA